jgi:hypothetical protein
MSYTASPSGDGKYRIKVLDHDLYVQSVPPYNAGLELDALNKSEDKQKVRVARFSLANPILMIFANSGISLQFLVKPASIRSRASRMAKVSRILETRIDTAVMAILILTMVRRRTGQSPSEPPTARPTQRMFSHQSLLSSYRSASEYSIKLDGDSAGYVWDSNWGTSAVSYSSTPFG